MKRCSMVIKGVWDQAEPPIGALGVKGAGEGSHGDPGEPGGDPALTTIEAGNSGIVRRRMGEVQPDALVVECRAGNGGMVWRGVVPCVVCECFGGFENGSHGRCIVCIHCVRDV